MNAWVRLRDPSYHDREGGMHIDADALEWHLVKHLATADCKHSETICNDCIDSWNNDYEVRL